MGCAIAVSSRHMNAQTILDWLREFYGGDASQNRSAQADCTDLRITLTR
jgi:hypothetical protein